MENQLSSNQKVRAHVFVSGTVHGVGFRLAAWDKANQWGIGGWVEEIPDGRVEIVFEGTKELVEAVVRWCYRGSPEAVVKNVTVEYEKPEGLKDFIIRRSPKVRVSPSVSGQAKTINILIFIGGLIGENHPQTESLSDESLWSKVKKYYNLSERIESVIKVNYSEKEGKVYLAQKFVAEQLEPERLGQNNAENNILLSGKERDRRQPWWRSLVQPLRQSLLLQGLGDLVYYAGEEGQIAIKLAVYSQVLEFIEKYRPQVEKDLRKEAQNIKVRLHLIGYSLGGAIAYDFLQGLFSTKTSIATDVLPGENQEIVERYQFWRQAARLGRIELGSIVSMASPLPILMMRSQQVIDTFALGKTLLADEIGIAKNAKEIIWKNFYNFDDLSAFPIRPLFGDNPGIQDIEVEGNFGFNEEIHKHVAELLHRRVVS
ncbi:acylphosphatase [Microseira sp. BLCC-F43]|jgi:acylphosphatase|uniref:acylphosphatase n=1 Tax=Microseira sp. BLCC-F43 TaxID=3153602 RepID=UPI0035B77BB4